MADHKGDDLRIQKGTVNVFSGVRDLSVDFKGDLISNTSRDSNGFETYLDVRGVRQVSISVDGLLAADVAREYLLNANAKAIGNAVVKFGNGATISANWVIDGYSEDHKMNAEVKCKFTLKSDGAYTYTAAA